MAKQLVSNIRKASSLIILAKDKVSKVKQPDFKALLFSRDPQASFMPNSVVFPGGVFEPADENPLWRNHFERMGVTAQQIRSLTEVNREKSDIFINDNPEAIERELSLRIAAVRETFEELGVIFCRDRKSLVNGGGEGYGNYKEDFDRKHWQQLVHNDASKFLTLCEELEIVPDLWSLYEWSNWLTPATFKKRFNTAFFLIALKTMPDVIKEQNEVNDFAWKTPEEYIQSHYKKEIWLPPPQVYELSRLLNFQQIEDVKNFAHNRSSAGIQVTLPVEYKCTDSRVNLLPGDDTYPKDPEAVTEMTSIDKTSKEFREGLNNIHRFEYYNTYDFILQLNFKLPYNHLFPLNINPNKYR